MKKQLLVWLALIVSLLIPLVAACGSSLPQQNGDQSQGAQQAGSELYVLDSYAGTGQTAGVRHLVALPVANPAAQLLLPAGFTDLKHQQLYVASSLGNGHTTISVFNTRTGASVRTFSIPGNYSTADQGFANSMLSGDGSWLALRGQKTPTGTTSIALVDTHAGKLARSINLAGTFTLDAVSPKGTMLYLLEYPQAGTSHYHVRAYDVQANKLVDGSIIDKTAINEKMQGEALTRQMSDDGDMAYTLYINTATNEAFIHILWLTDTVTGNITFPAIARCIDLPVGSSPALLRYYTLTLSQDGKTLYAANAALGTLATVNLDLGMNSYQLWLIESAKVASFNQGQSAITAADQARALYNGAALSRDQHLLYVVGVHGIWVLNVQTQKVQDEYLKQQDFTGLAVSGDGQTLYAVDPTSGIILLDPVSGVTRSVIQGSVRAPWGIAWVSDETG